MVYSLPMCKYVTRVSQISNAKTICFLKEREDNLIFALLATAAPEVRVGEAEGVVEADDGVQLLREDDEVLLGLRRLERGGRRRRGRDEGRGRQQREGEHDLRQHGWRCDEDRVWFLYFEELVPSSVQNVGRSLQRYS